MDPTQRPNCGNCGAELPGRLRYARMVTCDFCATTSVLKDDVFETAGTGGEMQDAPSLVQLGKAVRVQGLELLPVGHARFSYGRGWWDEFWCIENDGLGHWLSADEGDYALENELAKAHWPRDFRASIGKFVEIAGDTYTVTEAETGTCLAVRGEFPEELEVGETHLYFDLTGSDGQMATYEKWDGGEGWSVGRWIDPWDVRTL